MGDPRGDAWTASGRSLRLVLDAAVEAFVAMDADGRIVDWNRAAETTFGWSRDEALGADMADLLVPEDLRPAHRAGVARFQAGQGGHVVGRRIELRALHRSGREIPIELTLTVVEEDGRQWLTAFLHDISERKTAEAQLRRFEAIVRSTDDAILSGDMSGTIESWNPAAERLYGYTAQEMIGAHAELLRPGGSLDDLAAQRRRLREGEPVSIETRERRKDGSLVDVAVTVSPLRDEHGDVNGIVSVVRDVTERNRAAAELAEAHARFAGAFEAATTGIALVTPGGGRFLAVNPALCALLERDGQALLAASVHDITHPDDLAAEAELLAQTLAGERDSYQLTKRYLLPSGGIVWGLLSAVIVRDAGGAPRHLVAQIQDVTDRKTAEAELRRYAEQLLAVSDEDPLTGLVNRRAFEAAVAEELRVLRAGGAPCAVVLAGAEGDGTVVAAAAELADATRDGDVAAHLGGGQLALLVRGVEEADARAVAERVSRRLGPRVVRCSSAVAVAGDDVAALLARAAEASAAAHGHQSGGSTRVRRLLELARRQLDMPVSFLSRMDTDALTLVAVSGQAGAAELAEGAAIPREDSYCHLMLDGRIASSVPDTAVDEHARKLAPTRELGLRAYAGVPVRLRSGELYGTLCTLDARPRPELSERDVELLRFLGDLAAELVDDEIKAEADRRSEAAASGVRTLLGALEARDFYTGEHSKEVVALASAVARRLGLDADAVRDVEQVALLHDVGKVGIPDAILQKQGPLDAQEWELMRQHPVVGERIVAGTPGLSHLAPAMRAEHERWDGRGYPDGLAGDAIPLASRITLACDALHAMTSDRPYRPALSEERARDELQTCAGTQFDPRVVEALVAEMTARPALAAAG